MSHLPGNGDPEGTLLGPLPLPTALLACGGGPAPFWTLSLSLSQPLLACTSGSFVPQGQGLAIGGSPSPSFITTPGPLPGIRDLRVPTDSFQQAPQTPPPCVPGHVPGGEVGPGDRPRPRLELGFWGRNLGPP